MGPHRSALARLGVALVIIAAASLAWLQPWARTAAAPPRSYPAQLRNVQALDVDTAVVIVQPPPEGTAVAEGFESTDGGRTWRRFRVPPAADVRFVDHDHGFATSATRLQATVDGGRTWQERPLPPAERSALGAWFLDADHGWYLDLRVLSGTGVPRDMFRTGDGGRTWEQVWHGTSGTAQQPVFRDPLHGWMAADLSVLRTADGGRTWDAVAAPILDPRSAVLLAQQDVIEYSTALADTGTVIWSASASVDGGATWGRVRSVPGSDILGVAFVDARHWRAIAHYAVWRTDDGGETWQPLATRLPPRHWLGAADFLDADHGWALGGAAEAGYPTRVLRTVDGGASWTLVPGPWTAGG
jgi:photosystem II stability/assembly factor-like uncharacterized protein